MLDAVSLDQLRTFIAAADEGSFSAAGRSLRRAQSVVSQTLANLEGQLGVKLFDRTARLPVLTGQGRELLADARAVAGRVDLLKARAKGLARGLEPELTVVTDVLFPMAPLIGAVRTYQERFPTTPIRLYEESLAAVVQSVLNRHRGIGIMASLLTAPAELTRERLLTIKMAIVASPRHPLALYDAPIPTSVLAQHTQLVHTDRADVPAGREFGTLSPRTWLLTHLSAKLAFLRAGFGFGVMPLHLVEADLASGELIQISAEDAPLGMQGVTMSAVYRTDSPPGPAARWFIDHLKQGDVPPANETASRPVTAAATEAKAKNPDARFANAAGKIGDRNAPSPPAAGAPARARTHVIRQFSSQPPVRVRRLDGTEASFLKGVP
jgi:DNA-binding transcriptional LysR family regulator